MGSARVVSLDRIDLGIDTAADDASLALLRGDEVIAQHAWHVDSTMSKELLAHLDALLVEAGVTRQQIASIAVTNGPGTYGAVRTGLATAQGLALALDVPLAGIGRFEADAALHLEPGRVVVATHDTGRAGIAWAAYTQDAPGEATGHRRRRGRRAPRAVARDVVWRDERGTPGCADRRASRIARQCGP